MAVYYRCKICGGEHPSPIAFGDRESFESTALESNTFQCPKTEQSAIYNKEDMFWKSSDS